MPTENNNNVSAFVDDKEIYNKKPNIEPSPEKQIGINTTNSFYKNIIQAGMSNQLDMSALNSFLTASRSRDQMYSLIDDMSHDSMLASVLETYAEDATETNDNGDIVWAESSDPDIAKYTNYLLKAMRVNKNVYGWVHSLCKYGDIYLRLYRQSDYENDALFDDVPKNRLNEDIHLSDLDLDTQSSLKESVTIQAYAKNDHYVHYLEMVPNPAEMFELTKFGKTYAYIKSEINTAVTGNQDWYRGSIFMNYSFNKNDIKVFQPTEFVHGYLEDNSDRVPEEVSITFDGTSNDDTKNTSRYRVRRGQSLLYCVFKAWRMLQLIENSVLLNRVTKSAIVRLFSIEVGDMPKDMVQPHLQGFKTLMEQKSSLKAGVSMNEYTNPGPIENNIYVPTHNGVGNVTMQTVGGDVNVGQLTDLEYFRDVVFGALRIPKQFFGFTDDGAGFNGGTSLTIISARYAKMIVRIQNTIIQTITDAINLMLLDKGLTGYINNFTIKMKRPITQDEIDRRDNLTGNLQATNDLMNLLSDSIQDASTKLEILKTLLSTFMNNTELLDIIQKEIDRLTAEESSENDDDKTPISNDADNVDIGDNGLANDLGLSDVSIGVNTETNTEGETQSEDSTANETLPSPSELGIDFTDSNQTEFQQ